MGVAVFLLGGCAGASSLTAPERADQQVAVPLDDTDAPFGYHQYLPPAHAETPSAPRPLLVFLHGIGERGNGSDELDRVLRHGPPRLIEQDTWPSDRPFIVLSPQLDTTQGRWSVENIDAFIDHAVDTYAVDTNRIYLTGLSLGGYGTWAYAAAHSDRLAAIAPICGDGRTVEKHGAYCDLSGLPVWAFHGTDDSVVDPAGSLVPVRRLRECTPAPDPSPRLTLFPNVGHDSWSLVYDGSGREAPQDTDETPFDQSLYDWLLQHTRSGTE